MDKRMIAQSAALVAACTAPFLVAGCSVSTAQHQAQVPDSTGGSGSTSPAQPSLGANTSAAQAGERYDPNAETEIAQQSLKAWRTAVAHQKPAPGQSDADWKEQRENDEKNAMAQLEDLATRHPHSSTVFFMMGQVKEHFGKNKEAATFFANSRLKNTISPLSLFKLAQNERLAGDLKQAAEHFRKLYQIAPDFYPGRLGLAECVLKQDPSFAALLAQGIIDEDKNDPSTVEKAKEILSKTKAGEPSY